MSLTCCSVISTLSWWNICICRVSEQFIRVLLRNVFSSCSVSSIVLCSCLVGCALHRLLFVSYVYRSSGLSDICFITCIAFQFIYSTWIRISLLFG